MSTRWLTHCLCAALLVFGMVALSTGKPPDLPAADKVNCKDNPAVPEYGAGVVPAGAIEVEVQDATVFEQLEATTPIDTLYPWLDALICACEERVEVWFDDSTPRGLRATSSHAVLVFDDETPPAKLDAPKVVVPTSSRPCVQLKGVITPVGYSQPCGEANDPLCRSVRACCACINRAVAVCVTRTTLVQGFECKAATSSSNPSLLDRLYTVRPAGCQVIMTGSLRYLPAGCEIKSALCVQAADPVCRTVRACCGCVNVAVGKCANNVRACLKTKETRPQCPDVIIYSMTFMKDKAPSVAANCPVCKSFRACYGHIHCAMTVCVQDAQACVKTCDECTIRARRLS